MHRALISHPPPLTLQDICLLLLFGDSIQSLEQPSASQVGGGPIKELHGNFKAKETGLRRGWKKRKASGSYDYL